MVNKFSVSKLYSRVLVYNLILQLDSDRLHLDYYLKFRFNYNLFANPKDNRSRSFDSSDLV